MAPLAERVAAASAVARHPRIRVTALEARLGTRYTVDTLRRLLRWPAHRFVWLLGADNLAQLPRWRHWTEIIGRSGVAVFERLPYSYAALRGAAATRFSDARIAAERAHELAELAAPAWVFLRLRPHRASSTVIRGAASRRRQRGQDGEPDDHGTA
jgi:nicotinate-nucleotide adenylyltransferase